VSSARYARGVYTPAANQQPSASSSPFVPLLIMVLGLAIATIWFVAPPMLNQPAQVKRACEVIVLKSGKTRCVPTPGTKAAQHKAKSAKGVKQ
jgi:hypothetical protein